MKKNILLILLLTLFSFSKEISYDFNLTTISDENLTLEVAKDKIIFNEKKDKVIYLLFFGHNCKPCLKEIPEIKKLKAQNHKDLEILAFDIHGYNKKDLTTFKEEQKINYALLTREENKRFIHLIKVKTKWRGSLPYMVVLNKKGEVKLAHRGALDFKKFEKIYKAVKK